MMEKLFEILARGEMPDFLQVLQALNDISDIDWNGVEASQLSMRDAFKGKGIAKYPISCPGEFCESCG